MLFKCELADFKIEVEHMHPRTKNKLSPYFAEFENPDMSIEIIQEDIEFERVYAENEEIRKLDKFLELNAVFRGLANQLANFESLILHSACFEVDGVGVAFAAHSGTGKTTHMNLWQQLLGERMVIVNGDKPIVRFFEDEPEQPYAYGTPWNGKEHLGCNMRTPLKHICFIERSDINYVEKIDKKDAIDRIFNQVYMPKDPIAVMNTMQLIDRLLSCCNLWVIHCNMEMQAAEIAYDAIFRTECGK